MDISSIVPEIKQAVETELQTEIYKAQKGQNRRILVVDGKRKSKSGEAWIYQFEILEDRRFREDSFIKLYTEGRVEGVAGSVVSIENQFITLSLSEDIGKEINEAQIEEDITELYRKIINKIDDIQRKLKAYHLDTAQALFFPKNDEGPAPDLQPDDLNEDQLRALENVFKFRCSFIWGPPGTGKTKTLGRIVFELVKQGKRVLLSAHANRAADNALYQVAKAFKERGVTFEDKLTRYGPLLLKGDDEVDLTPLFFETQLEGINSDQAVRKGKLLSLISQYKEIETYLENRDKSLNRLKELEVQLNEFNANVERSENLITKLEDTIKARLEQPSWRQFLQRVAGQSLDSLMKSRDQLKQEKESLQAQLNNLIREKEELDKNLENLLAAHVEYEEVQKQIEGEGGIDAIKTELEAEDDMLPTKKKFLRAFYFLLI